MFKRGWNSLIMALFVATCLSTAKAQTQHCISFGTGTANVLDTYLSPFSYKGSNIHFLWNTERKVKTFGIEKLNFQTLLDIDASVLDNLAGNVNEYAGGVRFAMGWTKDLKQWQFQKSSLSLSAGPMISAYVGAVYNERNGNNPAQAKADIMIDLTARAKWNFLLFKKNMTLNYQIIWPMAGLAFSPNYGQSYYEIFDKGNSDHNIIFANFVNMPSIRQHLSIDIPLKKTSQTRMKISYLGYFMQSKFNNLRYHSYTNTFMIGLTKFFKRL